MIYSNRPLFKSPDGWLRGTLRLIGDNVYTLIKENGRVVSVQPNGAVDDRDPGTAGAYEQARLIGDKLVYDSGTVVVFVVIQ